MVIDNYALREYKKKSRLTAEEIAKKSGVSVHTLTPYLSNKRPITAANIRTLIALSVILDAKIEDLVRSRIDGVEVVSGIKRGGGRRA